LEWWNAGILASGSERPEAEFLPIPYSLYNAPREAVTTLVVVLVLDIILISSTSSRTIIIRLIRLQSP
jgi:hypothetical protein